jgi:hypothetical protein
MSQPFPSMIDNFNTDARGYAQSKVTVVLGDLPTTDPHVVGVLWNSSGTPTVSSG